MNQINTSLHFVDNFKTFILERYFANERIYYSQKHETILFHLLLSAVRTEQKTDVLDISSEILSFKISIYI